jgi:hypothetical protein
MATQKQMEVNRLNAKKPAGPRTAHAKAVSPRRGLKKDKYSDFARSTFINQESSAEFEGLRAEYWDWLAPVGIQERFLVEDMLWSEFRCRHYSRMEAAIWKLYPNGPDPMFADTTAPAAGKSLGGEADIEAARALERLRRLSVSCEKRYEKALKRLLSLRAKAAKRAPEAQSAGRSASIR